MLPRSFGAVSTLVSFHAHPDDESIACGGVMRQAADDGHRVVLVVATGGEHGEVPEGLLADGEELAQRRRKETEAAAGILGVQRVEFLGYSDSGMMGAPENEAPGSFWTTPVEDAAAKLAAILREESADAVTIYDDNGGYGHPDHIQVHRVGKLAAEIAGVERVYQSTMNRDAMLRNMAAMAERNPDFSGPGPEDADKFGKPEAELTTRVDVSAHLKTKRAAMAAHASQISPEHFMLAMPDEAFAMAFGTEWFIREGQGPGITETALEL